jgi:hypothetical protein
MKLKLKIDRFTTTEELVALTALFIGLSGSRAGKPDTQYAGELGEIQTGPTIVFSPPADAAELNEPEGPVVAGTTVKVGDEGTVTKRRRRTKAEIEAEIAEREAANAPGPFYWSHPESDSFGTVATRAELDVVLTSDLNTVELTKEQYDAILTGKAVAAVGNAEPSAPTPTANATATETATQEPAASAPATESPSDGKTYTHADVQKLAVDAARRFGPEKVKALIAEYPHAAKIADLTATDLPGFVTKLNELS